MARRAPRNAPLDLNADFIGLELDAVLEEHEHQGGVDPVRVRRYLFESAPMIVEVPDEWFDP